MTTGNEDQCIKVDITVPAGCAQRAQIYDFNTDPPTVTWGPDDNPEKPGQLTLVAYSDLPNEGVNIDSGGGTFNPKANYLGDIGIILTDPEHPKVAPSSASMSFMAPANSTVYFLVTDITGGGPLPRCEYKITVSKVTADPLPQVISFGTAPVVKVDGTGAVIANPVGPNSGKPITYTSLTPDICTISGTQVTGVAEGACTIAADQAGNDEYLPADQVTQTFPIKATAKPPVTSEVTPVPTLGEWSLMLLGLLAAGLGARRLRRP
ncbi:MAG: IPTL-CTERM sorting domain-containing protein [Burkholderiales bacterium]|nr:IPTL-CTERM sorting domain-containing protein [Burkholderiales bacterium]